MTARKKIVMVMDHTPEPVDRGEKFRTRRVLETLVREFQVTVVALERHGDGGLAALSKNLGFSVGWGRRVNRLVERSVRIIGMAHSLPCRAFLLRRVGLQRAVELVARSADLILLQNPYSIRIGYCGVPIVNELHGIESEYYRSLAETVQSAARRFYYKWEHSKLVRHERAVWNMGKGNIFLSQHDRDCALHLGLDPKLPCEIIAQGIDFPETFAQHPEATSDLFFCGNLSQPRNSDPLLRFIPLVREGIARRELSKDFKFRICGKGAPDRLKDLCDGVNIIYHGFVENLNDYLSSTKVVFCYLPGGSGVKTKIVEAFGFGKHVVCDELSARALPELFERSGTPVAANYEDAYAVMCRMLMGRCETADIQRWVRERYSWDALMQRHVEFLKAVMG